jgi:NAD(P)-dependent dehydrogenase (short-subunit alcohol dehydrogenase family)
MRINGFTHMGAHAHDLEDRASVRMGSGAARRPALNLRRKFGVSDPDGSPRRSEWLQPLPWSDDGGLGLGCFDLVMAIMNNDDMEINLQGRTAFVSGSTQGIGRTIAAGLARAGATTVVNGRHQERVEAAVRELRAELPGAGLRGVAADVSTAEGALKLLEAVPAVDILVNNLGIFGPKPVLEVDDEEWRRYFEVNVLSGIRLARQYLPGMTDRGWGRVQFIASDSAVLIPTEMVHYGVTKTALLGVSRGYAKAVAGTGVTVNTVLAGPTRTGGVESFVAEMVGEDDLPWDQAEQRFMAEHRPNSLLQRLIAPEEIANMVVYLSSEQASATTGGALRVDGGYVDSILP